jgi:hypothetical protein
MKLVELYSNLKDKIVDDDIVKENFQNIFNKYKKGNNANKEAIEEIEKKFFAGEKFVINKQSRGTGAGGAKKEKKKIGVKRTYSKMRIEDETDSIVSEQNNINSNDNDVAQSQKSQKEKQQPVNKRNTRQVKNRKKIVDDSDNDGNDNDSEY